MNIQFFSRIMLLMIFSFPYGLSAHSLSNLLQNDIIAIEKTINHQILHQKSALSSSLIKTKLSQAILNDEKKRIRQEFKIIPYFQERVTFWFSIYTQYPSEVSLIHDRLKLSLIYDVVDFSDLYQSPLTASMKEILRNNLIKEKQESLRHLFAQIPLKSENGPGLKKLRSILMWHKLYFPKNKYKTTTSFQQLASQTRSQTGQKDLIFRGVLNALPFFDYLYYFFDLFSMPRELLAIPFLESSFNLQATSKVGASGIWQFMPSTANSILPMKANLVDGRLGPILPTLGAIHLLRENFQILKRWDLAVTAYNSGTKHLQLAKKKLNDPHISLEQIFRRYKNPHLGFASQNFYAEFLALVHVLSYKDVIYIDHHIKSHFDKQVQSKGKPSAKRSAIFINVSKCSFIPDQLFKSLKRQNPLLQIINQHLLKPRSLYPRGTIFLSQTQLDKRKFFEVRPSQLKARYPKFWPLFMANQSCSTK
jgi:membrane-bound lytic murein transglycosylase D